MFSPADMQILSNCIFHEVEGDTLRLAKSLELLQDLLIGAQSEDRPRLEDCITSYLDEPDVKEVLDGTISKIETDEAIVFAYSTRIAWLLEDGRSVPEGFTENLQQLNESIRNWLSSRPIGLLGTYWSPGVQSFIVDFLAVFSVWTFSELGHQDSLVTKQIAQFMNYKQPLLISSMATAFLEHADLATLRELDAECHYSINQCRHLLGNYIDYGKRNE